MRTHRETLPAEATGTFGFQSPLAYSAPGLFLAPAEGPPFRGSLGRRYTWAVGYSVPSRWLLWGKSRISKETAQVFEGAGRDEAVAFVSCTAGW